MTFLVGDFSHYCNKKKSSDFMKNLLLLLATVAFFNVQAQETRQVGPFNELVIKGKLEVMLEQGDTDQIIIEDSNVSEGDLNISLQGGTLKLSLVDGWLKGERGLRVTVRYHNLREIRVLAGATLESRETIVADRLEVKAGSGAQVDLTLEVNTLEAGAVEGAQLDLRGTANSQYASAATGGKYDGSRLECARTEAKANTGGEVTVVANAALDATANTGGRIRYIGEPAEKYTKSNLAGDIRGY
jgi:hypothetical protein